MSEQLPSILARLARAGWGELAPRSAQGARAVLQGLAAVVDPSTGAATLTAWQVAAAAGRCERRTRDALHLLEQMGVITWTRGWLDRGTPRPGWIRVSKRALWAMIRPARRIHDEARARRAAELRARIRRTLRLTTQWRPHRPAPAVPARHRTLSVRADITASLPPSGVQTTPTGSVCTPTIAPTPPPGSPMPYIPDRPECPHGVPDNPMACPHCRRILATDDRVQPADLLAQPRPAAPPSPPGSRVAQLKAAIAARQTTQGALL